MPEPITPEQLENATRMAAKVVGTFGDDWQLRYDPDEGEVSCRTDDEGPVVGSFVEVFSTSQWPSDSDHSPVAEFLCASIVMVPRLVGEVERLKSALAQEGSTSNRLLDERDDMEKLLDTFAYTIAPEEVIGEHSSGNDPWENALDLLTPAAEVDRLKAELKANRQRWYHNDQSRTECVAGFDPETRECAEDGGKVFSEVEYQAQLIEIWTDLTRSYERDVARLTSERDRIAEVREAAVREVVREREAHDGTTAELRSLRAEVDRLKAELAAREAVNGG